MPKPLNPPIQASDYAVTFGHPSGERVLTDLREGFHYDGTTYRPGCDPLELAYREGQRSVVLWLLARVEEALEDPQGEPETSTDPSQDEEAE